MNKNVIDLGVDNFIEFIDGPIKSNYKVINLLDSLYNGPNKVKYDLINFPDGQTSIEIKEVIDQKKEYYLITRLSTPKDFFLLGSIADIFERYEKELNIVITYLSTARSDRLFTTNRPVDLKVVVKILEGMLKSYHKIVFIDIHNFDAVLKYSNRSNSPIYRNCSLYYHNEILQEVRSPNVTLIFPDKGALRNPLSSHSNIKKIVMEKVRLVMTGEIVSLKIADGYDQNLDPNSEYIIIDDLCDGGSTFVRIANFLKDNNIDPKEKCKLIVPHMVQYNGIKRMSDTFKEVITTNSFFNWEYDNRISNLNNVKIIKLG